MKKAKMKFLATKIKLSFKNLAWLFRKPRYLLTAIILALIFFELVYWMFNLQILGSLLSSAKLDVSDKLGLIISPFSAVQNASGGAVFALMIALSIGQGFSLSALIYTLRHQPKIDSKLIEGGAIVSLLAIIGLGCPACGTSLLTPIVALFASGSAVVISETITMIALPAAMIMVLYGLYSLGLKISTIKAAADKKLLKLDR